MSEPAPFGCTSASTRGSGIPRAAQRRRGRGIWGLAATLFTVPAALTLIAPSVALGQDAVTTATEWLRAAQDGNGRWAGDERLALRDTAEALRALELVGTGDTAVVAARVALRAAANVTVDLESRRLEALSTSTPSVVLEPALAELSARSAPDGGWGLTGSFEASDALDTALALRALLTSGGASVPVILSALSRIDGLQDAGGGFAQASGERPDLVTTAEVVHTLAVAGELTDVSTTASATVWR